MKTRQPGPPRVPHGCLHPIQTIWHSVRGTQRPRRPLFRAVNFPTRPGPRRTLTSHNSATLGRSICFLLSTTRWQLRPARPRRANPKKSCSGGARSCWRPSLSRYLGRDSVILRCRSARQAGERWQASRGNKLDVVVSSDTTLSTPAAGGRGKGARARKLLSSESLEPINSKQTSLKRPQLANILNLTAVDPDEISGAGSGSHNAEMLGLHHAPAREHRQFALFLRRNRSVVDFEQRRRRQFASVCGAHHFLLFAAFCERLAKEDHHQHTLRWGEHSFCL